MSALASPRAPSILNVDDDDAVRASLGWFFRDHGFEVISAGTGVEALRLAAHRPDVVVLDVGLPDMTGLEVCRRLKSDPATSHTPILILSGQAVDPTDEVAGLSIGAESYLVKPVDPDVLLAHVKSLLRLKRAEDALRERELFLRNLIDHLPCGVFWKDRNSVFLGCNAQVAHDLGLQSPEALVGRTDRETLENPAEAEEFVTRDRRVMVTGRPLLNQEEVRTRQDGSRATLLTSKVPLRDASGAVIGVLGTYLDISDRIRSEDELREWKNRYEAAIRASDQILYDWDTATDMIRWAGCCEKILGYTAEEVPPTLAGWIDLIHPEDRPGFDREARRVVATGEPFRLDYRFRRRDGTYIVVEDRGNFFQNADGSRHRMVGFVADVTERKRMEEQLRQSSKMEAVGQLAGGVAHDFNNLLTVISGYGELVAEHLSPDHPAHDLIRELTRAGERAAGLTRQLLAFSRRATVAPRQIDLNAVVTDLEKMLRRLIGEDVTLSVRLQPHLGPVKVDQGQIEQVILNLVVNARDAMPTGGRLTIETREVELDEHCSTVHGHARPGHYVLLAISDTGIGMTPEVKARLFEPFFTTKPAGQGTGLGLATVHGIVRQAGCHIAVYSEPGHGTTMKVYLPRADAGPERLAPGLPFAMTTGTETILLTEDEAVVRALTRRVLEGCGYTVIESGNGDEALRIAESSSGPIHLLVTDVVMPGVGGRELAERLVGRHPNLRVLYLSGYTEDAVVRHGILEDRVNFLHKPFTPAALARKVREVLDGK